MKIPNFSSCFNKLWKQFEIVVPGFYLKTECLYLDLSLSGGTALMFTMWNSWARFWLYDWVPLFCPQSEDIRLLIWCCSRWNSCARVSIRNPSASILLSIGLFTDHRCLHYEVVVPGFKQNRVPLFYLQYEDIQLLSRFGNLSRIKNAFSERSWHFWTWCQEKILSMLYSIAVCFKI